MPHQPDQMLLHYRLIEKLGEGGMGEVWRALDTTLDREVAIKMLPEAFSSDEERLARFEREAKLLATLNHPNIAAIYGLHHDGERFLAMELVPGQDLAERLASSPLSVEETTDVARQIAEALEAAHEQGVVHRDLKPANVKMTSDGTVKVLDFGLAKAMQPGDSAGQSDLSLSPTVTSAGSIAGVILGTASYMSPEQARGQPVDRRTDVWSFGCLLYELLTGKKAFGGGTVSDALASILAREPEWSALPASTPKMLRRLIERCLTKNPLMRLRDIGEARIALSSPREDQHEPQTPQQGARDKARGLERAGWLTLLLLVGAALVWQMTAGRETGTVSQSGTAPFSLRRLTDMAGPETHPSLSPDGRQLIYSSRASGNGDIYLLRVDGLRSINLTSSSEADESAGVFSPDGERIAFRSERDGGGLFLMGATGESVRRVTDGGFDPDWSPDGRKLAYSTSPVDDPYLRAGFAQLWTIDLDSGEQKLLVDNDPGDGVQPSWSPSGTRIAYWSNPEGNREIWTVSATGGDPVQVTRHPATDWSPTWSPDGRWIYFSSDRGGSMNLWRVPLDESTGATRGDPEPVTNSVRELGHASMARDGRRMVAMAYDRSFDQAVYELDAEHGFEPVLRQSIKRNPAGWCTLSGDGQWLGCSTWGAREDLVIMRTDGSELRRLTDHPGRDRHPFWSPDGDKLAFMSTRTGGWRLWSINVDGSDLVQRSEAFAFSWVWSSDSTRVLAASVDGTRYSEVDLGGQEMGRPLSLPCETPFFVTARSPDGKQLAGRETMSPGESDSWKVCDLESGVTRRLASSETARPGVGGILNWLDDSTLLVSDGNRVLAYDLATERSRTLMTLKRGDNVRPSAARRLMLVERTGLDSEIWLLSRDTQGFGAIK